MLFIAQVGAITMPEASTCIGPNIPRWVFDAVDNRILRGGHFQGKHPPLFLKEAAHGSGDKGY